MPTDTILDRNIMTATRRISQATLGLALAAVGAFGVAATWASGPAFAQPGSADGHGSMHEMMRGMHGDEAVERMHEIDGMDEMMDECGGMMDAMGGMSDMSTMMNGQERSNMMRGMMGR